MKLLASIIATILFVTATLFIITPPASEAQSRRRAPSLQASPPPPPPPPSATPPPQQEVGEDDVVRIETDLVTLTATVTDSRGRYVANLRQSDVTVYEDGVRQELAYFNTDERVPVSLGIIFDTSGSMVDKIDGVRDAIEHFVESVASGDEIFLVRFGGDVDLVQDFTDDRRRILRAIGGFNPHGSTALYDAIILGLQRVTQGRHRKRALLLVTDGNDTASSADFQTALALARRSEVTVYALGIGHGERGSIDHGSLGHDPFGRQIEDSVDMRVLNAFADATGGRGFYLENAHAGGRDRVEEAALQVAAELTRQYTLGYRPSNRRRDGTFRQIRVELADRSLRVRTRRGYYAPREDASTP